MPSANCGSVLGSKIWAKRLYLESQTQNLKAETQNLEAQTTDLEAQTENLEGHTKNLEAQTGRNQLLQAVSR